MQDDGIQFHKVKGLRRNGITNQNGSTCSGRADMTAKGRRKCKFDYFSAFKATDNESALYAFQR